MTDGVPHASAAGRSLPVVHAPRGVGHLRGTSTFVEAARIALGDQQLRQNLGRATTTIRGKRARVVGELPDWEQLRDAAAAIKRTTMMRLPDLLIEFERNVTAAGGVVHWARDAVEANGIVTDLVRATAAHEVVKVKSMATQEIGLTESLAEAGIRVHKTDLAELIVQLGDDQPSHIVVPEIHRNRTEIRDLFLRELPDVDSSLTDDPAELAATARRFLRGRFLEARVAIFGANFAVAESGTVAVVESEGNGRMCLTLPETLITVMGVEKLVPSWRDLEVFLQMLARSATGERMNPYTSMWTGVQQGDGPSTFHLVLLDNGRSAVLADEVGRTALHCIRCAACLNVCPVYTRTGGHSYGSVYPGPIGAILSPQLTGIQDKSSLPFASTLCGACEDVCPVRIPIPQILVHLRAQKVDQEHAASRVPGSEALGMALASALMVRPRWWRRMQSTLRLGRIRGARTGRIRRLPGPLAAWTASRDLPVPPPEMFNEWWRKTGGRP